MYKGVIAVMFVNRHVIVVTAVLKNDLFNVCHVFFFKIFFVQCMK